MLKKEVENNNHSYLSLKETLKIHCENCSGLCCVALYCGKTDGFPENKEAGIPCKYLLADFRCDIHSGLAEKSMRGCLAYDCFGAGQKVTGMMKENWKKIQRKQMKSLEFFLGFFSFIKCYGIY